VLLSGASVQGMGFVETPFRLGRFAGNNWGQEGRFTWDRLANGVATSLYAAGPFGTSGFHCPYFVIADTRTAAHFVFSFAWSAPWRAEVVCDATLRGILHARIGPSAPAPMRVIEPGETLATPPIHIGHLYGDLDATVQATHAHIRRSVTPVASRMTTPLVTYNGAGAQGLDCLTEEATLRDIDDAKDLGAQVYMTDAGWFGRARSDERAGAPYPRYMGDWTPGEWYPNGFGPVRERLTERDMLLGLWIEPEGIGLRSGIYEQHPEWVVRREGQPLADVAERLNTDFTNPEVREWIESELVRVVREYGVDVIRFDGAPMSAFVGDRTHEGFTESIAWRHYELLYGMMERLVQRFPDLIIENCCGGGGRLDLGMMSRSHRTQISDETRPPRSVQIMNGITMMLPPELCVAFPFLPDGRSQIGGLDFSIRVTLFGSFYTLGWTSRLNEQLPQYRDLLRGYIELYSSSIAPWLPGCSAYHHTPIVMLDGAEPTPYCTWEYVSADKSQAIVGIFKLTAAPGPFAFRSRGLDAGRQYRVTFGNDGSTAPVSGYALRQEGVTVELAAPLTSELLIIDGR
jgi:alpha-galactosidase